MKRKFIILFLALLTFIISCNKDSAILNNVENESIVSINVKNEVEKILNKNFNFNNSTLVKPIVMWDKAVKIKNNIEVELKITDNKGRIMVPAGKNEGDLIKIGKYILRIDENNASNMYIFTIIPDSKAFFVYNDATTESLNNPVFSGIVEISGLDFKPFVAMKYQNGKKIAHSENVSPIQNVNRKGIEPRGLHCWWEYTVWIVEVKDAGGNTEHSYSDITGAHIVCVWTVDDAGNNGTGVGSEDWCVLYPWLCDASGGSNPKNETNGQSKCNCTGSGYGTTKIYREDFGKLEDDIYVSGYWDFWLDITNGDCHTGNYDAYIYRTGHAWGINATEEHRGWEVGKKMISECKWKAKYRSWIGVAWYWSEFGINYYDSHADTYDKNLNIY